MGPLTRNTTLTEPHYFLNANKPPTQIYLSARLLYILSLSAMNSLNCSELRQGDTAPWIFDRMWPFRLSCYWIKRKFLSPLDKRPNFGRNISANLSQSQPPRPQRETGHRKEESPLHTLVISKNKIIFLCCSNLIPYMVEFFHFVIHKS